MAIFMADFMGMMLRSIWMVCFFCIGPAGYSAEAEYEICPAGTDMPQELGRGTFSRVFKAKNKETGFFVALRRTRKTPNGLSGQGCFARDLQGARIQQELSHPHIMAVLAIYGEETSNFFDVIMPYQPRETLWALLRHRKGIPEEVARPYLKRVLSGLQYLHERSIIHRDIKAENILVPIVSPGEYPDPEGIMIIDFGFAVQVESLPAGLLCVGTFSAMAPEVLFKLGYDHTVDIWAVACLYHEMLLNEEAFFVPVKWREACYQHAKFPIPENASPEIKKSLTRIWYGYYGVVNCPERTDRISEENHRFFDYIFLSHGKWQPRPTCEQIWSEFPWTNPHSGE
jgi:serine/threonine protein kinase